MSVFLGISILNLSPAYAKEDLLTQVFDQIQVNLEKLNEANDIYQEGLKACEMFLTDDISLGKLNDLNRTYKEDLSKISFEIASEELKQETIQSDYFSESLAFGEVAASLRDDMINNLDMLDDYLATEKEIDTDGRCQEKLEQYSRNMQAYLELCWFETNDYLIDVPDEEKIQKLCETAKLLPAFQGTNGSWTRDISELDTMMDLRWSVMEGVLEDISVQVGDDGLKLDEMIAERNQSDEEIIQYLVKYEGLNETIARKLLELRKAELELASHKQMLADKFASSKENTAAELFQKAAIFASVEMYDKAEECIACFMNQENQEYTSLCGAAARCFYKAKQEDGIYPHGLLITDIDEESEQGVYEAADILVAINNTRIETIDDYTATKDERQLAYVALVLRINENGEQEEVSVNVKEGTELSFGGIFL